MTSLRDIYFAKVKIVLGAFRASKVNLLLIFIYLFGVLFGSIIMSIIVVEALGKGMNLSVYADELSALISLALGITIIASFRGFVVFDYEENMFFTSTITPRKFLAATILSDLTVFSIFFCPLFVLLGIIAVFTCLSLMITLSIFTVAILLILLILFLKKAFSILISVYADSPIRHILAVFAVLLLLPAMKFVSSFPVEYSQLPYPSTFIATALLHLLCGKQPPLNSLLGVFSYFALSFLLLALCSRRDIFRYAKPVPFFSPFDTSTRAQTIKMGQNIRLFSKIGLRITLNLESESPYRFLIKKELIRMIRDGSLFAVLIFYIVVLIISVATKSSGDSFPAWILILAMYSLIVPTMLISNWRVEELNCLWIPLTSSINLKVFFSSLLYAFILVSIPIPMGVILILSLITNLNPVTPLVLIVSASTIGSSIHLFVMTYFLGEKRRATPGFMISSVSLFLSGILLSPSYAYVALSFIFKINSQIISALGVGLLIYSYAIFRFFLRKIEHKVLNIEIEI